MRRTLGLLFLFVFALSSLLPAGFMLQATTSSDGRSGAVEVVICTEHGSKLITLDADGEQLDGDGEPGNPAPFKSGMDSCPYSAASGKALASAEPQPLAQVVRYAAVAYRVTAEAFRATPQPGAVSARGPPLSTLS